MSVIANIGIVLRGSYETGRQMLMISFDAFVTPDIGNLIQYDRTPASRSMLLRVSLLSLHAIAQVLELAFRKVQMIRSRIEGTQTTSNARHYCLSGVHRVIAGQLPIHRAQEAVPSNEVRFGDRDFLRIV